MTSTKNCKDMGLFLNKFFNFNAHKNLAGDCWIFYFGYHTALDFAGLTILPCCDSMIV